MKALYFVIYLCIVSNLSLYAGQKEQSSSMKGVPREIWLNEIICSSLEKGNIFEAIRDLWTKRAVSTFYRDLITPQNIVKCIKQRKLEYLHGEPILSRAIRDYHNDATKKYLLQIIHILVDGGLNVNLKSPKDSTALHQAAYVGETKIVSFLLDHGAAIDALDNENRTPLTLALLSIFLPDKYFVNVSDTVRLLVQRGASFDISPQAGKTVLKFATDLVTIIPTQVPTAKVPLFKQYIQIMEEEAEKEQREKKK